MEDIKTVGVVGAGQMGNGIAHVSALAGYDVILNDVSQDALDKGLATIENNLGRQVARELITIDEMKAAQARIQTSVELVPFAGVDLAIEALFQAADEDSATGLPDFLRGLFPVIATVSADGYHELDDDEIRDRSQTLVDELADRGLPT